MVAADGSGQFKTCRRPSCRALGGRTDPVIIHVKPGIYRELVYIQREKRFFQLVGEDPANTVITYGLYASLSGPLTANRSARSARPTAP